MVGRRLEPCSSQALLLEAIHATTPMTARTRMTPTQTPALKMPAITIQPVRVTVERSRSANRDQERFMGVLQRRGWYAYLNIVAMDTYAARQWDIIAGASAVELGDQAACTVATHSSTVVSPHNMPMPPPPKLTVETGGSLPKLCLSILDTSWGSNRPALHDSPLGSSMTTYA